MWGIRITAMGVVIMRNKGNNVRTMIALYKLSNTVIVLARMLSLLKFNQTQRFIITQRCIITNLIGMLCSTNCHLSTQAMNLFEWIHSALVFVGGRDKC